MSELERCLSNRVMALLFFVVVSGEIEVVLPCGVVEALVAIYGPGEYTGEANMLSGRRSIVRIHATKPGKVI